MDGWDGVFHAMAEHSLAVQTQEPGDYVEDGILYCGKCRTKKQAYIDFQGEKVLVGCACQCQSAKLEAEKETDKRRQRYISVMRRVDWCDICVKAKREQCHPQVLSYLDNWDEMLRCGTGLVLCGPVGTGKSTSAAYLARALRKRFIPAIMTNLAQFGDVRDRLPDFSGVDLLVLDDLGIERQSEFMRERAFEIVDGRSRCGKPTVFTTNLAFREMKRMRDGGNIYERRLYSRVLERAVPVRFSGEDYRTTARIDALRAAQERISGQSGPKGGQDADPDISG